MLDVRRLRVLREVAVRGSFSAAADALAYTQSAISQQIAALEREAGTTLVERNARGVRLTDAGRALVEHADAILARLSDAEAELEAIAGLRRLARVPRELPSLAAACRARGAVVARGRGAPLPPALAVRPRRGAVVPRPRRAGRPGGQIGAAPRNDSFRPTDPLHDADVLV